MRLPSPRVFAVTSLLVLVTSGCTYESGAGPEVGRTDAARVVDDAEPTGPLAFTVDGLAASRWRVHGTDLGLNLRVRPGTANRSLGRLTPGTVVTATGDVMAVDDVTWFHVDTGDRAGWVHADFLLPVDPEVPDTASGPPEVESRWPAGTLVAVSVEPDADLREGPAGPVIEQVPGGTELVTTGTAAGDWTEVRSSNLRGWVATDSLEAVERDEPVSPFAMGASVTAAPGIAGAALHATPDGEVVGGIPPTETGTASGRAQDGWSEVTHRSVTGWARTTELVEAPPTEPPADTARIAGEGGVVTVHLGPSGLDEIIGTLDDGEIVSPTGMTTEAGWSEVHLDDARTGWVPTVFLETD